jgi:hypothetical protein
MSVILYIGCENMYILLSFGSSSVELIMGLLQARVILICVRPIPRATTWVTFYSIGVAICSLITLGLKYIKLDGSYESSKFAVDSGFFITPCSISSVSLERSCLWLEVMPLVCCNVSYPLSGVVRDHEHALTRVPFMML